MASSTAKLTAQTGEYKRIDETSTYESLLKYISKNVTIKNFIAEIKADDVKISQLITAIKTGDPNADIFKDPNCYFYLLFLIKQKSIPFWEGMTVYIYLMALMQFTDLQPLHPADADVKFLRKVSVKSLVEGKELSELGKAFVQNAIDRFKTINYQIDLTKLIDYIINLSPVEQWVMGIELSTKSYNKTNHCDDLTWILLINVPFLYEPSSESANKDMYWVPSSSLIHFFLNQMSAQPVKMQPIFGSVGPETIFNLHQENTHPIALYATGVNSNPKKADSYRCGPFVMWLHDIGHTFWGTMLSYPERMRIFTDFIPPLKRIKAKAEEYKDNEASIRIQNMIDATIDYNLTNIRSFANPELRFEIFLTRMCRIYPYCKVEFENIGVLEDRVFFLMMEVLRHDSLSASENELWESLRHYVSRSGGQFYRDENIANTLMTLAGYSTPFYDEKINWQEWLHLTETMSDSKSLWDAVTTNTNKHHELLCLITRYRVKFFHPYLPMEGERKEAFITFLKNKIAAETLITSPNPLFSTHTSLKRQASPLPAEIKDNRGDKVAKRNCCFL